jgi:hypothetical protein
VISDLDAGAAEKQTRDRLSAANIHVSGVREQRYSLEDVFIRVVEQARSQGKVAVE